MPSAGPRLRGRGASRGVEREEHSPAFGPEIPKSTAVANAEQQRLQMQDDVHPSIDPPFISNHRPSSLGQRTTNSPFPAPFASLACQRVVALHFPPRSNALFRRLLAARSCFQSPPLAAPTTFSSELSGTTRATRTKFGTPFSDLIQRTDPFRLSPSWEPCRGVAEDGIRLTEDPTLKPSSVG